MTKPKKLNFSPEFRLETAQLVVDNGYTHQEAALSSFRTVDLYYNKPYFSQQYDRIYFTLPSLHL